MSLVNIHHLVAVWLLSCVRFFVTPWTVALQALLSTGFLRQEYWSGLPCPRPGDLSHPGMELTSLALQVNSFPLMPPGKTHIISYRYRKKEKKKVFSFVVRTFTIYFLSNFQIYHTAMPTIVICCTLHPWNTFITVNLCLFVAFSSSLTPYTWQFLTKLNIFLSHIWSSNHAPWYLPK